MWFSKLTLCLTSPCCKLPSRYSQLYFRVNLSSRFLCDKSHTLTTRPDLALAVHQECARFSIDPKQHHGAALRWIGWYLAGSKDKEISSSRVHHHLFGMSDLLVEQTSYRNLAFYNGRRIRGGKWSPSIRHSMMHIIIPELAVTGCPVNVKQSQVYCKMLENNSWALEMFKVHKLRPRTKHISQSTISSAPTLIKVS